MLEEIIFTAAHFWKRYENIYEIIKETHEIENLTLIPKREILHTLKDGDIPLKDFNASWFSSNTLFLFILSLLCLMIFMQGNINLKYSYYYALATYSSHLYGLMASTRVTLHGSQFKIILFILHYTGSSWSCPVHLLPETSTLAPFVYLSLCKWQQARLGKGGPLKMNTLFISWRTSFFLSFFFLLIWVAQKSQIKSKQHLSS